MPEDRSRDADWPATTRQDSSDEELASVWQRLGASTIDTGILAVVFIPFNLWIQKVDSPTRIWVGWLLPALTTVLYWAFFEGSRLHATPGKVVFGLAVVTTEGTDPTPGRATGRAAGRLVSGLLLCAGYLLAIADPNRQTLHDKLADTLVVRAGEPSGAGLAVALALVLSYLELRTLPPLPRFGEVRACNADVADAGAAPTRTVPVPQPIAISSFSEQHGRIELVGTVPRGVEAIPEELGGWPAGEEYPREMRFEIRPFIRVRYGLEPCRQGTDVEITYPG